MFPRVVLVVFLVGCASGKPIGSACTTDSDCAQPGFCAGAPFVGGSCTTDCSAQPCSAGTTCGLVAAQGGDRSFCLSDCTDRSQCRDGAQCFQSVCQPNCSADSPCPTGSQCDGTGACVPYDGVPAGGACDLDTDCATRKCLLSVCIQACNRDAACPDGQTCVPHRTGADGEESPTDTLTLGCATRRGAAAPAAVCDTDADCDRGGCLLGICVEACATQPDCHAAAQQCVKLTVPLDSGDVDSFSACIPQQGLVSFDVPTGTAASVPPTALSLSFFTEAPSEDVGVTVGVIKLVDPTGATIYTEPQSNDDFYKLAIRYVPTEGTSTMRLPNSPAITLLDGAYLPTVATSTQFTFGTARAYLKISSTPVNTGNVSLNFYVTDLSSNCTGSSITVANAPNVLSQSVDKIKSIYAQAGITITEVTWHGANGAANTIRTNTSGTGASPTDLDIVLRTATGSQSTTVGMDVVLLRSITDLDGHNSGVLGIAGGIPASPLLGTPHSGAVVSIQTLCSFGPQVFGETTAHELGHTLGLFHNGEMSGQRDPLTDTSPTDMTNLMYWEENSGDKLSAQQGTVLRGDPKIRF